MPEIRYGQPTTRALMRAEVLGYPLITADPVAQRLASEQCKRELLALSAGGGLVRAVRDLLWKKDHSLRSPELSIAQVAERLGYRNAQNFERAFRPWTDTTPAAYRRERDLQ